MGMCGAVFGLVTDSPFLLPTNFHDYVNVWLIPWYGPTVTKIYIVTLTTDWDYGFYRYID